MDYCPPLGELNEAKWYMMPRFETNPWMKQYKNDLKEVDKFLKANKIKTKSDADKAFHIIFKLLNILSNVTSMGTLGFCATGVGIIAHVFVRTIDWAMQSADEYFMEQNTNKVIKQLEDLHKNEKDPKKKEVYEKALDKMKNAQEKFKNRPKFKDSKDDDEQGMTVYFF